ncbi:N-acetyldiaminopimelate deacetylase [Planctomycetes bacterium Poly30]|uniref:N-acetyldiaminopimelate deacetylase n=1 Tax=Saltatorellus ferox TaxID=2528018 RepID=A0A518EN50_9BACT|nr:N-acetyldiaminopimelate deacetylase [Planctomycetes bacterium Poly30]
MKLAPLAEFRRALHRQPEVSGREQRTSEVIAAALRELRPDRIWTSLGAGAGTGADGGFGVAAAFDGTAEGPTVLFRAELDALPIQEAAGPEHASEVPGVAHLCGHDGHMTILLGLARRLAARRPDRGRAVLLFQPAEETGEGARAIVRDPRFAELRPDHAFALHNLPGSPLGEVVLREGTFNCASRGFVARLVGRTSHAAHPEDGLSPAAAMCELAMALTELHLHETLSEAALGAAPGLTLSTLIHARLGEVAFGTAPGEAFVMATLRAEHDAQMGRLSELALGTAERIAAAHGLRLETRWQDEFRACVNSSDACSRIVAAAEVEGLRVRTLTTPFRWSEDFGSLRECGASLAMFGLGAGESHPQLHAPDYDFPDALIERGAGMFWRVAEGLLFDA